MIELKWTRIVEDKPVSELRYGADEFANIVTDLVFTKLSKNENPTMPTIRFLEIFDACVKGYIIEGKFIARMAIDEKGFYFIDSFKGLMPKNQKLQII